jgi:hypothetical protein
MSAEEVAAAFVEHYYTTVDTDPTQLEGLYVISTNHHTVSLVTCFYADTRLRIAI